MSSTLIPEQYVVIPSTLAATIGLEEAVLLQVMHDCLLHRSTVYQEGAQWMHWPLSDALKLLPFWNEEQLERIARNLHNLGIIQLRSHAPGGDRQLVFALHDDQDAPAPEQPPRAPTPAAVQHNAGEAVGIAAAPTARRTPASGLDLSAIGPARHTAPRPQRTKPNPPTSTRHGAVPMHESWQPNIELLRKLKEINGIPSDFALQLVPEFVLYWSDRRSATFSWEARFMKHATREWRQHSTRREEKRPKPAEKADHAMHDDWRPSDDALQILVRGGIDQQFIEDAIPEFVLYWRDRGDSCSTWDSRFIAHIRRQWARFESSMRYDTEPHRIDAGWQPSPDVYDILRLANIDLTFAEACVAEFVIYWRDTNQVHNSWNTRFLQHVKTQWARRHHLNSSGKEHGKTDQSAADPDRRGFIDKHTDQSWREGL